MDDQPDQQPEVPSRRRDIAADILQSFALERRNASSDRVPADADRGPTADHETSDDDLAGVYSRMPGFIELDRDIARAKRTGHPLTLVSVEVDEFATSDEPRGFAAHDRMVADAAHAITAHVRPYDLVIRSGDGAFVCAMSDFSPAAARERLVLVNAAFADSAGRRSLATGAVVLRHSDSRDDVVARAFAAVSDAREGQHFAP